MSFLEVKYNWKKNTYLSCPSTIEEKLGRIRVEKGKYLKLLTYRFFLFLVCFYVCFFTDKIRKYGVTNHLRE